MFKRKAIGIKKAFQLLDAYAEIPIRMAEVGLKQAVELSGRLNICACDAYVLACAINQPTPLLTLDGGLERTHAGVEIGCIGGQSAMKSYSYSEARGNFATVLDKAERDGAVEIRRRDGTVFRILPLRNPKHRRWR